MSNNEQIESQETEQKQDILTEAELNEVSGGLKELAKDHSRFRRRIVSNDHEHEHAPIKEIAIGPVELVGRRVL